MISEHRGTTVVILVSVHSIELWNHTDVAGSCIGKSF